MEMEGTIKVREFFAILKKRLWLIVSITLVLAIGSGIYSVMFMKPMYESSVQIMVDNTERDGNYDYNYVTANFQYINTYSDLIYAPVVIERVINNLNLNTDYDTLASRIDVTSNKESQIITIYVKDPNHVNAVQIANSLASVFKNEVNSTLNLDNVILLSEALDKANPEPINSSPVVIVAVAILAGIILGYSISFLLEFLNNTITSERDIEEILNIRALGAVPVMQAKDLKVAKITYNDADVRINKRTQSKGIGGNVS